MDHPPLWGSTRISAALLAVSILDITAPPPTFSVRESGNGAGTGVGRVPYFTYPLAGEAPYRLEGNGILAEQLLGSAACGGDPEIVRMALERIDWPRDDPRWFNILEQPLRIWNHGSGHWANPEWGHGTYLECFRLVLNRCDPNIRGRMTDQGQFGLTILHSLAGSREHVTPEERIAFATMLLDAGAPVDVRDNLLKSTPLGWACRWGRIELVKLLLEWGENPVEADAEPWATPKAWAQKMGHDHVLRVLREHGD